MSRVFGRLVLDSPTNGKPRVAKELVSALNGPSEWTLGSAGAGERKAKQKG